MNRDKKLKLVWELGPALDSMPESVTSEILMYAHVLCVLKKNKGRRRDTAKALGISERSLYNYIQILRGYGENIPDARI